LILGFGDGSLEWTIFSDRITVSIAGEQLLGPLGQLATHLSAFAFDPWNHHAIVSGRPMTHPGDDRSFGTAFKGNSLGSSHCSRSNGRGMNRHSLSESISGLSMLWMERQKRDHRSVKIFDILRLDLFTALRSGHFSLGVTFRGSFGLKLRLNLLNGGRRRPNAPCEDSSSLFLGDDPMISCGLYTTSQSGVTGRE